LQSFFEAPALSLGAKSRFGQCQGVCCAAAKLQLVLLLFVAFGGLLWFYFSSADSDSSGPTDGTESLDQIKEGLLLNLGKFCFSEKVRLKLTLGILIYFIDENFDAYH